jgi:hypothetical protein
MDGSYPYEWMIGSCPDLEDPVPRSALALCRVLAPTMLALTMLAVTVCLPLAAPARAAGGRCADSPHYQIAYWARTAPVAELDVNIMACPWTLPDQWTVQALPRGTRGSDLTSHRLRAWVVNGDTTPTYRTVTVEVHLDRCDYLGCERDLASWRIHYLLGNDGVYVTRTETVDGSCGYLSCDYQLKPEQR